MAKRTWTWEARLTRTALAALPVQRTEKAATYGETASYTLSRCSEDGEHEWELEVQICGSFEPAQNGGRTDPSWDASIDEPAAFYFREGKGWSLLETTSDEDEAICAFLFERVEQDDGYDGPDYDDGGGRDDYYSDRAQNDWESSRGY